MLSKAVVVFERFVGLDLVMVREAARVIFYSAEVDYVYLMTIYAKNQRADISAKELRVIKELIQ